MLTSGRAKSVQDAPTTNDHGCTDAKPSECPKGDRDNKSEVYFKNRLFLQAERSEQNSDLKVCQEAVLYLPMLYK